MDNFYRKFIDNKRNPIESKLITWDKAVRSKPCLAEGLNITHFRKYLHGNFSALCRSVSVFFLHILVLCECLSRDNHGNLLLSRQGHNRAPQYHSGSLLDSLRLCRMVRIFTSPAYDYKALNYNL